MLEQHLGRRSLRSRTLPSWLRGTVGQALATFTKEFRICRLRSYAASAADEVAGAIAGAGSSFTRLGK